VKRLARGTTARQKYLLGQEHATGQEKRCKTKQSIRRLFMKTKDLPGLTVPPVLEQCVTICE